jgi:hypothetical protein
MLSVGEALDILNTPSVGNKLPRFSVRFATLEGKRYNLTQCERTGHKRVNLKDNDAMNVLCHTNGEYYMVHIYTITRLNGIPVQPE